MINFCTLFDSNYSAKGLAMYYSLLKNCHSFHLYIFAFDDKLVNVLVRLRLEHVTIVTLKEFEDEDLLNIKPTRTAGEYCWTCTSSTILYCFNHYHLENCTYVDSDLYFFSDPQILIEEMGDKDVSIIPHRYTQKYDQTLGSGKYCVQFMTFKNTEKGITVLKWWRDRCIEWCYARTEDGKFGDQKYLDDWLTRFDCVCELKNIGGGIAPWNQQQYSFYRKKKSIFGKELSSGNDFKLIFYHFHALSSLKKRCYNEFYCSDYDLPISVRKFIYNMYFKTLIKSEKKIRRIDKSIYGLYPLHNDYPSIISHLKKLIERTRSKNIKYKYWIG